MLLSTEPYRFRAAHLAEVARMARPALLVDGEMVSWYGSRAARGLRWLMALRRAGDERGSAGVARGCASVLHLFRGEDGEALAYEAVACPGAAGLCRG